MSETCPGRLARMIAELLDVLARMVELPCPMVLGDEGVGKVRSEDRLARMIAELLDVLDHRMVELLGVEPKPVRPQTVRRQREEVMSEALSEAYPGRLARIVTVADVMDFEPVLSAFGHEVELWVGKGLPLGQVLESPVLPWTTKVELCVQEMGESEARSLAIESALRFCSSCQSGSRRLSRSSWLALEASQKFRDGKVDEASLMAAASRALKVVLEPEMDTSRGMYCAASRAAYQVASVHGKVALLGVLRCVSEIEPQELRRVIDRSREVLASEASRPQRIRPKNV